MINYKIEFELILKMKELFWENGRNEEFHYDPEADQTFSNWFEKCEDILGNDIANIQGEVKVRLLSRRLGTTESEKSKESTIPGLFQNLP